jgi:small-conductance mechanosensitive channel
MKAMDFLSDGAEEVLQLMKEIFLSTLLTVGKEDFNLIRIMILVFALFILFWGSSRITRILVTRILVRYNVNIGTRNSIGAIFRYLIMVIGLIVIVQSTGVDLTALGFLAGALGVGIGFGLQNITDNFISGLIIIFEQPIKVGDRIQLDDLYGDVTNISSRTTTIHTNDNISVIVPNSEFVSSRVINWSHNDRRVRFQFPVGVSYRENPDKVKEVLLRVLKDHPGVLDHPEPDVWFDQFGSSSLDFKLMGWTSDYISRPPALKSQLYYEIFRRFGEEGIEIPFPQRDIHIRSGKLPIVHENNSRVSSNGN